MFPSFDRGGKSDGQIKNGVQNVMTHKLGGNMCIQYEKLQNYSREEVNHFCTTYLQELSCRNYLLDYVPTS